MSAPASPMTIRASRPIPIAAAAMAFALHAIAAAAQPVPTAFAGRWLAEDIRNGGVIDRLQTVLELGADGAVSGSGGCNRMTGRVVIAGHRMTFGPLASTKMACAPA